MGKWKSESDARRDIRELVAEYYREFKKPEQEKPFHPGDRIGYAGRVYDEKEMMSLTDAVLDFWLTAGRFSEEFEQEFSRFLGVRYAILTNSGSSANLLAFMALTSPLLKDRRIRKGDEVITVSCGFPTTVAPILQFGAVPVFLDVTIPQYNLDVTQLEEALSPRTKAVMIAHTLGNPFNIAVVKDFCDRHRLWLVEDNCDALGSRYTLNGLTKYTGTWGDIGTSSFYPPHHMTMGEGGCVYTQNPVLNRAIRSFRDWGRDCVCPPGKDNTCGHRFSGTYGELPEGYDHKYVYSHLGYNLKVTDLQAAIGVEQLKKFPEFIIRRKENWQFLRDSVKDLSPEKIYLPEPAENSDPSWFGFLITLKEGLKKTDGSPLTRNAVTGYLEAHNIQTRLLFSGNLIRHPAFDDIRGTDAYRVVGDLSVTDYIMNHTFWIGVYPGMTKEKLSWMSRCLHEAFEQ